MYYDIRTIHLAGNINININTVHKCHKFAFTVLILGPVEGEGNRSLNLPQAQKCLGTNNRSRARHVPGLQDLTEHRYK